MRYMLKIDEHLIQYKHFNVKNDGNIDFSFKQKISVQELFKVSVFSRQDKTVPYQELNPGLQITSLVC